MVLGQFHLATQDMADWGHHTCTGGFPTKTVRVWNLATSCLAIHSQNSSTQNHNNMMAAPPSEMPRGDRATRQRWILSALPLSSARDPALFWNGQLVFLILERGDSNFSRNPTFLSHVYLLAFGVPTSSRQCKLKFDDPLQETSPGLPSNNSFRFEDVLANFCCWKPSILARFCQVVLGPMPGCMT